MAGGGVEEAVRQLSGILSGTVDTSVRRRAEYSSDASNYRVVPAAVVFPRSTDDVVTTVRVALDTVVPLTARGAGTSIAGNAIGPGLVLDLSRHLNRVVQVDPDSRSARVEPGVVLADLQRAAAVHGLRFGPDPSTTSRCTLGGMIGNNACGPRAVAHGRTADNVRELEVVDGRARRLRLGTGFGPVPELDAFTQRHLGTIRTELGRFGRQISGYSLEHLLPERRSRLARAFVGTEGSCGVVLDAVVELVPVPAATALAVLAYPDLPSAADDVPGLLALRPDAIEAMDARLVDVVRRARGGVPELPAGAGWLFVETSGSSGAAALAAADAVCAAAGTRTHRVLASGPESAALWRIRADGVGLAGRTPAGEPAWAGWEDAAVPPDRLGAYLRDFDELKRAHGVDGLAYGHFGDGCVHTRLDLPIVAAPQRFRAFLMDAARLVASHGGSLSGEHGDGRARGELLPLMYSPAALGAFAEFKRIFDPQGLLNPGIVVDPAPLLDDLRLPGAQAVRSAGLALVADHGDLTRAVHRCVGVGSCRTDAAAGGVMCPSFRASRDEKDSTRGRARVLQEVVNGSLIGDRWDSAELAESLELCLSCKACRSDCPAGVDMAAYKAEVLYRRYRGRLRPRSHYGLGWLPRWLAAARRAPVLVNRLSAVGPLRRTAFRAAGLDLRRDAPGLSSPSFSRWWGSRAAGEGGSPEVVVWVDTFTDALAADAGRAAVELLESAGHRVLAARSCCGLTFVTTGQLDAARRRLRHTVATLLPHVEAGRPVIGLEPSCLAVLRSDLVELMPDDPAAARVASHVQTLAEFLTATSWPVPDLNGTRVLAQPHCHQHAVMGYTADRALLERAGAAVRTIDGCCGLAGNFGMERGHYETSIDVARTALLPALEAEPDAVLLADGFSCRTQAAHLGYPAAVTLAQLLTGQLSG